MVDTTARKLGIERAQCYRLLRRLRADPTLTALMPGSGGRPIGLRLLDVEVEAVISAAIDEFYLTWLCPSVAALVREVWPTRARDRRKAEP
jgi:putative transposase